MLNMSSYKISSIPRNHMREEDMDRRINTPFPGELFQDLYCYRNKIVRTMAHKEEKYWYIISLYGLDKEYTLT